jgi:hypothetical protein
MATQMQFTGLDPGMKDCELQLRLPSEKYLRTGGTNPLLEIWQVEAEAEDAEQDLDDGEGTESGQGPAWKDFVVAENSTTRVVRAGNGTGPGNTTFNSSTSPSPPPPSRPTPLVILAGGPQPLSDVRANGDIIVVPGVVCNQTLTFQAGIQEPGAEEEHVSYWDFMNVAPPMSPVQGWRVVYKEVGC